MKGSDMDGMPSKLEGDVLMAWRWTSEENNVFSFKTTATESEVHISKIRRAVRALSRKGYVEYHQMSWDDDGLCRGAGYGPTFKGYAWINANLLKIEAA